MAWQYTSIPTQHFPNSLLLPMLNQNNCLPHENLTSLPPNSISGNSFKSNQNIKKPKQRRFSDPGPINSKNTVHLSSQQGNTDELSYLLIEETKNDFLFNSLLQELRFARQLNRHLCLELNKAKAQLQLYHQQTNDQPGSIAALVRRLYDSHHIRSDVLNNWNKTEDLYGRTSRSSFKHCETDETDHLLMREREILMNKLQSTERKIQQLRNSQWDGASLDGYFIKSTGELRPPISRFEDSLSSKASRSQSFVHTSPSSSDPPSLEDLDQTSSKCHGGRLNSTNMRANLPQPNRTPLDVGLAYSHYASNQTSASIAELTLKRDLQLQLANVERDRRKLEQQLVETIGTQRHSNDRVIKLERLVSVLRKKLEDQTTMSATVSSPMLISPKENNKLDTSQSSTFDTANQILTGPCSLPSYLQVVGPITQL